MENLEVIDWVLALAWFMTGIVLGVGTGLLIKKYQMRQKWR